MRKHEEEFESELDELIAGISKIKNSSKLFSKGNIDSDIRRLQIIIRSRVNSRGEAAELSSGGSVMALPGIIYFEF